MKKLRWTVNGIDLEAVAEEGKWHLATVIALLKARGLSRKDANDYAEFVFCAHATINDCRPEDYLDDSQYERLIPA